MGIDDRPTATDRADSSALKTDSQQEASARPRFGNLVGLTLVFLLALAFSLLSSSVPYLVVTLAYGPAVARNLSQAELAFFFWLRDSFAAESFLVFYLIGRRIDFRGRYPLLAVLSFVGALVGELPQFVLVHTPSVDSSVITGFSLASPSLGDSVSALSGAFQAAAIPFAGLALAFLREGYLRDALWPPSSETGERQLLSRPVLAVGFAILIVAYLAAEFTDVIGSRLPQLGQSALISSTVFSPYDAFVYDFFYPLLFFIAFYFLGKRLDTLGGGIVAFAVSVFVSGALGYLIGNDLVYFVRVFESPAGQNYAAPFSLGLPFLENSIVQGLYVLAFGFAASSLGFVRNMQNPVSRDRLVAVALVAAVVVLLMVSVVLAISPGSSGAFTTITTASSTSVTLST